MPAQPDRQAALEQYRRRSGVYDLELALFEPFRGLRWAPRWALVVNAGVCLAA